MFLAIKPTTDTGKLGPRPSGNEIVYAGVFKEPGVISRHVLSQWLCSKKKKWAVKQVFLFYSKRIRLLLCSIFYDS